MKTVLLALTLMGIPQGPSCAESVDWPKVIAANSAATVLIRVERAGEEPGFGSGTVISADGYVLTAKHILPAGTVPGSTGYVISGLAGWTAPSIDYGKSKALKVVMVSTGRDFAVLKFSHEGLVGSACMGSPPISGEPLLVMGYPSGGNLTSTAGIASGADADDLYKTDAVVGVGNSGGPVFDAGGRLKGVLLRGAVSTGGHIALGDFLPVARIMPAIRANLHPGPCRSAGATAPTASIKTLKFSYHVSEMQEDHSAPVPMIRSYSRQFFAQPRYIFADVSFHEASKNHVPVGPTINMAGDFKSLTVTYTIESGPFYDQWRGWLDGDVLTTQKRGAY